MEQILISDNLYQYHFPKPEKQDYLDPHITIFQQEDQAVLLDCGFESQGLALKNTLDAQGIAVQQVLLSHFHPDHYEGYHSFEGLPLYASNQYHRFYAFRKNTEPDSYLPLVQHELSHDDQLAFGEWNFRFHEKPGHSPCTLVTQINQSIFHIGDLVLVNDQGKLSLPYVVEGGDVPAYLESLDWLERLDFDIVLLSHGFPIRERAIFRSLIQRITYYLESIWKPRGKAVLEDCILGEPEDYIYHRFHKMNCQQIRKNFPKKP